MPFQEICFEIVKMFSAGTLAGTKGYSKLLSVICVMFLVVCNKVMYYRPNILFNIIVL